jgi:hypothetical protein
MKAKWPCEGYVTKTELKFEIESNQYTIRIYAPEHKDNYIASALIRTYGDRGFMSNIIGAGFYEVLHDHLEEILTKCNVATLEGYMTDAHARLLRMQARGRASFSIQQRGMCAGREMPWVILSRKNKGD